jgi:hypothetical protein
MEEDSGKRLTAFLDYLVDKLFFTVITVTDELNAFRVFETLNARGVRLSAADLLKNYLFSLVSADDPHETELTALEDRWDRIIGLLGQETFPEFLRVFWNSQHRLTRKSELFKTIKKSVTDKEKAFALLRDLDQSAAIYAALRDPADSTWNKEEKQSLEQLRMFDVQQPLAMLMACHSRFFTPDRQTFTRTLNAIAIISLRFNVIGNLHTSHQEAFYNQVAVNITKGALSSYSDIFGILPDIYPGDEQFKTAFAEKEFKTTNSRNKKIVRFLLFKLENKISNQSFDSESATYSLEHILPEHPSASWGSINEPEQNRMVYRLGNMTILETNMNIKVGNAGYDKKTEAYRNSDFQITRSIPEHYDTWNESKVASRQKHLAEKAAEVWRVSF